LLKVKKKKLGKILLEKGELVTGVSRTGNVTAPDQKKGTRGEKGVPSEKSDLLRDNQD